MPLSRITLRQLEAFAAVAELRSFSAASLRLGMTPSAVSQLVSELESVLGFRLFDRNSRKVDLSSTGREYIASAQSVLRHLHLSESTASDLRNRAAGIVRVGAPQVLAAAVVPAVMRDFLVSRPNVVLRIRDTPVYGLVDSVASGDVDIAVGPDRATMATVTRRSVLKSPWVLWCAREHPLSRCKQVRWSDLKGFPMVAAGRDHELSIAQAWANGNDGDQIGSLDVVECVTTSLGLVAAGNAVTIAPAYIGLLAEKFSLVMRQLAEPLPVRQICIYEPTARSLSPAAEAFSEFLASDFPNRFAGGGAPREVAPQAQV